MAKLVYTDRALADLDDIATYSLENWGRRRARRYVANIRAACRLLSENPFLGPADDIRPGLRRKLQVSHIIFYRKTTGGIRPFSLLPGIPKEVCSGVFFGENAHKSRGPGLHLQGKWSSVVRILHQSQSPGLHLPTEDE